MTLFRLSLFLMMVLPVSFGTAAVRVPATSPKPPETPKIEVRQADEVQYDGTAKTIDLKGDVHVVRGTMSIKADNIHIHLSDDEKKVQSAVATGHVEVVDGDKISRADRAEYVEQSSEIILTGHPRLWNGPNQMEADRIIYNLNAKTMKASGHVRGTFLPGGSS